MQTEQSFEHLVNKLNNPALAKQNQMAFNQKRFENVLDALRVRPAFLPVQIELPNTVQTLAKSGETNDLQYDVIVTGAITDGEEKKVSFGFSSENTKPFVSTNESGTQISLEAIARKSLESAGSNGIQLFAPFLLESGDTLKVDIYKPVATAGIEICSICFVGYRVFSDNFVFENFNQRKQELVKTEIEKRRTPQQRFDVCKVAFANNRATAFTTKVNEPRLIHGFRTNVKNAMITLGYDNNEAFAKDYFPIWALAAESGNNTDNYRFLKRPIFLNANEQLYFLLKDTINGTNFAADGQIEVIATTV